MTVKELIKALEECPPESEVMIEHNFDPCDTCSKIKHYCDLANIGPQFAKKPYYHSASDETRIGSY